MRPLGEENDAKKIHGLGSGVEGLKRRSPLPAGGIGFLHYGTNFNDPPILDYINIEVNMRGELPAGAPPFGVFVTGFADPSFHPTDAIVFENDADFGGQIRFSNNSGGGSGILIENNGDLTGTGRPGIDIEQDAAADAGQEAFTIANNGAGLMSVSNNGGRMFMFASDLMEIEGADGIQLDPDSGYLTILDLPSSTPGGSNRVWNNGGVLNIT